MHQAASNWNWALFPVKCPTMDRKLFSTPKKALMSSLPWANAFRKFLRLLRLFLSDFWIALANCCTCSIVNSSTLQLPSTSEKRMRFELKSFSRFCFRISDSWSLRLLLCDAMSLPVVLYWSLLSIFNSENFLNLSKLTQKWTGIALAAMFK